MVTIKFLNGKEYMSGPVTVGLEKKLARYGRDAMAAALEADDVKDIDADTAQADSLKKYNSVMDKLEDLIKTRDQIIMLAFAGQFTVDEYENNVTKEEAVRVIQALQGVGNAIIEKNAPRG